MISSVPTEVPFVMPSSSPTEAPFAMPSAMRPTTVMMPATITPTAFATTIAPSASPETFAQQNYNDFQDNILWMVMWFITMIIFVAFPLVTSKRRRQLCLRGIRERRWIPDEEWDNESAANSGRRQQERQQQREEIQRRFQTTRTQEDSIRQQYLSILMERYTIVLEESDIIDDHEKDSMESSEELSSPIDEEKEQTKKDVENHCDTTIISGSSQDTLDTNENNNRTADIEAPTPVRENRADSGGSEDLLACDFDKNQWISVPLAGQPADSETVSRRLVSNGCAISLCPFEAGDKVTYSSNPNCCHAFHTDSIINWYLAVGRKTQRRRKKNNPNMTDEEALDLLCDFPINCPCCRQPFSIDTNFSVGKTDENENNGIEEGNETFESAEV